MDTDRLQAFLALLRIIVEFILRLLSSEINRISRGPELAMNHFFVYNQTLKKKQKTKTECQLFWSKAPTIDRNTCFDQKESKR